MAQFLMYYSNSFEDVKFSKLTLKLSKILIHAQLLQCRLCKFGYYFLSHLRLLFYSSLWLRAHLTASAANSSASSSIKLARCEASSEISLSLSKASFLPRCHCLYTSIGTSTATGTPCNSITTLSSFDITPCKTSPKSRWTSDALSVFSIIHFPCIVMVETCQSVSPLSTPHPTPSPPTPPS